MSYKYKYENEKEKLHSEEGLRVITYTLRIVHDLLEEAGAVKTSHVIDAVIKEIGQVDPYLIVASLDELSLIGQLREVNRQKKVDHHNRIFIR